MTTLDKVIFAIVGILAAIVVLLILFGCAPHPVAHPISSSHSQLTATEYDLAEAEFSGGAAPLASNLAAVDCQALLDRRDTASAFVLGLTGLGGAGGLATLIPKDADPDEAKRWNLGLGISTLAVGTAATILGALVRSWSSRFEEQCHTRPADPASHTGPAVPTGNTAAADPTGNTAAADTASNTGTAAPPPLGDDSNGGAATDGGIQ